MDSRIVKIIMEYRKERVPGMIGGPKELWVKVILVSSEGERIEVADTCIDHQTIEVHLEPLAVVN